MDFGLRSPLTTMPSSLETVKSARNSAKSAPRWSSLKLCRERSITWTGVQPCFSCGVSSWDCCWCACSRAATPAVGQGVQAGTVSGVVQSVDKLPLPGVTVTATSPNLQGERIAVSDENGVYYLRGLPPGTYRVNFDISGFQPATREGVQVGVGGIAAVDATMSLAAVTETVTVTAEAPSAIAAPKTSQTYTKAEIDALPVGRRPIDIAELSPGVTTNVFNPDQLTLAGSFGFDNVFMVNGVDINDNILGTPNNLFIEDAVQETIGADARHLGRVRPLLRRRRQRRHAQRRQLLQRQLPRGAEQSVVDRRRRRSRSAGNIKHADVLEQDARGHVRRAGACATACGSSPPAGYETANMPNTFAQNGAGYTRTDTNRRGEVKFTGTIAPAPDAAGQLHRERDRAGEHARRSAPAALLDASMLTTRAAAEPAVRRATTTARVTPRCFATVQYSEKKQSFRNNGGTSTDTRRFAVPDAGRASPACPAASSTTRPTSTRPTRSSGTTARSPAASRTSCRAAASAATSSRAAREYFVSTGIGGNSQSSTGYVFVDRLPDGGRQRRARRRRARRSRSSRRASAQIWNFHGDARRGGRHQDDVGLPAGSLDGDAAPDARPRHALRDGAQPTRPATSPTVDTSVDRAAAGRELRPAGGRQDGPLRHLRSLLGQVQPGAVRA